MERLNPDDQVMLWPDQLWPQEIGAVIWLDGRGLFDDEGRFRIDAVRQMIEGRLHEVPRLRQILYSPRRGLGGPLWVDAPRFDLRDHVRVVPLCGPAAEPAILAEVERLRRQRLDRSRPLWLMSFLTGLPDDRVVLFAKIHHAIADGIAGIATVSAFLDTVPDATAAKPVPWMARPAPRPRELFADNMRRGLRQWGHALAALAHPVAVGRGAAHGWREVRKLLATDPVAATSLNRVIGPDRTFALVRGRLDEAKNIAHAHDATVNDVLLTVIAGGLRALLLARGESVDDAVVRIDVPLTLRPQQAREQARGNFISQLFVPVPLGIADPVLRLKHISADTAVRKAEPHVSAGVVLSSRLVRRLVRKVLQRYPVNVTTADLPGPPIALYFAGAPVLEVFPVLPLMANVSLGVGALSYAGQFNLTVIGDRDTYPDLDVFTRGLRAEWAALTG